MFRLLRFGYLFLALFAGSAAAQTKPTAVQQYWITYAYVAATGVWGLG